METISIDAKSDRTLTQDGQISGSVGCLTLTTSLVVFVFWEESSDHIQEAHRHKYRSDINQ